MTTRKYAITATPTIGSDGQPRFIHCSAVALTRAANQWLIADDNGQVFMFESTSATGKGFEQALVETWSFSNRAMIRSDGNGKITVRRFMAAVDTEI